ncbi:MAG: hypothetical protein IKN71_06180 [Alphaproteobacteria bacterium]|nr:hypothetical protein [Alphaproteobacteria bacterium]
MWCKPAAEDNFQPQKTPSTNGGVFCFILPEISEQVGYDGEYAALYKTQIA